MQIFKKSLLLCTVLLVFLLAGCGGSSTVSDSGSNGDSRSGGVTAGVAVDPYIVGAIFYEDKDNSGTQDPGEQQSNPSDEFGRFTFEQSLTSGSTLIMKTSGLHNGVAFTGSLRRLVRKGDEGELAATPLTTLLASGLNEDQVRTLLDDAGLALPAEADLYINPMEDLELLNASEPAAEDLVLLKANMALNAYLSQINAFDDQEDLVNRLTAEGNSPVLSDMVQAVNDIIDASVSAANNLIPEGSHLPVISLQCALKTSTAIVDHIVEHYSLADGADIPSAATTEELVSQTYLAGLDDATLIIAKDAGLDISAADQGADYCLAEDGTVQRLKELDEYLSQGLTGFSELYSGYIDSDLLFLDRAKLHTVRESFKQAVALVNNLNLETAAEEQVQQADQARFFFALTRILTVLNITIDDTRSEGFKDIGDILEVASELIDDYDEDNDLPDLMSGRVFDFAYNVIGMELIGAIGDLAKVSEQFSYNLISSSMEEERGRVEFDYADAMALKGGAEAAFGLIDICAAYDLDVETAKTYFNVFSRDFELSMPSEVGAWTMEKFLAENTTFGTLIHPQRLTDALVYLNRALGDLELSLAALKAETDDQSDDFIEFGDLGEGSELDDTLAMIKELLSGPATLRGGFISDDDVELNLPLFFEGLNLRQQLPVFDGNIPGFFPDATFGGILVNGEANDDLDNDLIPDLMQGHDFYRMNEQRLADKTFDFRNHDSGIRIATIIFNSDLSATVTKEMETVAATWSVDDKFQLHIRWGSTDVVITDVSGSDYYEGDVYFNGQWVEQAGGAEAVTTSIYASGDFLVE